MRADQLYVVTARFNPMGYRTPELHYAAFVTHMLDSGVNLVVVECAYGEIPFRANISPRIQHVGVRADSWTFCKENLLNIGISRVPEAKYIAWIDSDVFFHRADWAVATLEALNHYRVVQPWSDCYDLGPNGEHLQHHRSFCHQFLHGFPIGPPSWKAPYCFPHPGFAWAIKRDVLDWTGGFLDIAAMGSGDHHQAYGFLGQILNTVPQSAAKGYVDHLLGWQRSAASIVNRRIGYVRGTIEHRYHGAKRNRAYQDRWKIFIKHAFDPITDLKRNTHGVIEWAGNKPELEREFDVYLRNRNEDSIE